MTVTLLKQVMPKSLLGRSLLIIVTPLILLQVIATGIFFESHWDKVTFRLARGVAGDVASVVQLIKRFPEEDDFKWIRGHSAETFGLIVTVAPEVQMGHSILGGQNTLERKLIRALRDILNVPFHIDNNTLKIIATI